MPIKDLTGLKYGKLRVVEHLGDDNKGHQKWRCICDCGNEKITTTNLLTSAHTRSCGCLYPKAEDLTGKRFGKLVVIKKVEPTYDKSGRKYTVWECLCDCGNKTKVRTNNLKGSTTSCGCYLKSVQGQQTLKHGYRKTRLYTCYNGMKQRCYNPNSIGYKNYGGRGIKVCDEWNKPDGLKEFAEWALKNGYQDNLTLERIDVNGNYEPDNCCWITKAMQAKNTRRNVFVEYEGKKMILSDFSREVGINHRKVSRYLKQNMTINEILEKELGK